MKTVLDCPCGHRVVGVDEDDLVAKTREHLADKHPDHSYSRDEILFIAREAFPGERLDRESH
jgi:hypothetical protein